MSSEKLTAEEVVELIMSRLEMLDATKRKTALSENGEAYNALRCMVEKACSGGDPAMCWEAFQAGMKFGKGSDSQRNRKTHQYFQDHIDDLPSTRDGYIERLDNPELSQSEQLSLGMEADFNMHSDHWMALRDQEDCTPDPSEFEND